MVMRSLQTWMLLVTGVAAWVLPVAGESRKPYAPPICPHILGWPDDVKEWANGAPWIKALDITSCGIAKERGARVFYRVYDHASGPDGDTRIGGQKFGQEILDRLAFLPKGMWPDAIGFLNEFGSASPEKAQCFIDMYDVLRAGGYEGMIVYGSYGPGGPDMEEWAKPHVKAACLKADAIETHEYWDLTIKHYDTWLAHRHVRMMNEYPYLKTKPWFIGEFGSDGVNKGEDPEKRSGWRDRDKLTADEYIRQIEIYRYGDETDGVIPPAENVLAVFLYQQGAPPHMWQGWETRGTKVMGYMQSTWKPTHGFVKGKVKGESGRPVEGAEVIIRPADAKDDSSGKKVKTDVNGEYWLFALMPGEYELRAAGPGLPPMSTKLTLRTGEIEVVNLPATRILGYLRDIPAESPEQRDERHRRVAERRKGHPIIFHRGAVRKVTENTLECYSAAIDMGADGVEIDIHRTRDGVLVLQHDDELGRTFEGGGKIKDKTYYELLQAKIKSTTGHATRETRIPTLASFLELARRRAMLIHLDVKQSGIQDDIIKMIDTAGMWDHIVEVNGGNADKIRPDTWNEGKPGVHNKVKLIPYAQNVPLWDGTDEEVGAALKEYIRKQEAGSDAPFMFFGGRDHQERLARILGGPPKKDWTPIPPDLRAWWEPDGMVQVCRY